MVIPKSYLATSKRWVLLEHTGAPDDHLDRHFDLLLEEELACRTWRLEKIPKPGDPPVELSPLADHHLKWLNKKESEVSGDRGKAKRVFKGTYKGPIPIQPNQPVHISLNSKDFIGILKIQRNLTHFSSVHRSSINAY